MELVEERKEKKNKIRQMEVWPVGAILGLWYTVVRGPNREPSLLFCSPFK